MATQHFDKAYGRNTAENYERFFVPAIGAPLAADLVRRAALRPGERVLDVACGTGVVARHALQDVGADGTVAGLDVNPGMLAVARSTTPAGAEVDWYEASAESMPLPDESFDVVFCQLGLQLMPDRLAALHEMRRVLVGGGRLLMNVPGPAGRLFALFAESLERHIGSQSAAFARQVFALNDVDEIQRLTSGSGFRDVQVSADTQVFRLPPPKEFLWQYVHSTPLAGLVAQADDTQRESLERDTVAAWKEFVDGDSMKYEQRILVATARK